MSCHHLTLPQVFRLPLGAGIALLEARRLRMAAEAGLPPPGGGYIDQAIARARRAKERELRATHTILPNPAPETRHQEPGTRN